MSLEAAKQKRHLNQKSSVESQKPTQASFMLEETENVSAILKGSLQVEVPAKYTAQDNLLVCHEWDNTIRWQPGERLHHLFENRVDQFRDEGDSQHLAVDSADGQWSYQALDERANQLARLLTLQGLRSGDRIGLLVDKSVHSYVSMLAVQKINAAYVPLDPAFPADRIAYIACDAELKLILTLSQYESLTTASRLPTISLDMATAEIDRQPNHRLTEVETGSVVNELSYIIYTSGSTGMPKGVPIDQASICNFIRVAAEVYGYQSSDRVYQGLTIAFDFAVEEIWVPLIVGATLLPNRTGSSLLGCDLADFLLKHYATALCCVPTLLATIEEDLPELRLLIVSGEACPKDLISRWSAPHRSILNAYGPTETTVTATLARSKPDEPVTIGKPLPTYSVIILEPGTEKVLPFGEEGEIAIAGVGVASSYLNREEQTRKAFIKDFLQIKNNPSGLIYRTGDLGLINENGDIEYRGRIDLQVKIRGYRIELAEIESIILAIPQVAQVVVDTFEPLPDVKELVTYYTLKEGVGELSQEALTNELREHLPDYMVPSYYEHLDIMPMMASDKADRKALPKPSGIRMNVGNHSFVNAKTVMQKDVSAALAELLNLDEVSVEDNFFVDLGASSLLMARFCANIRQRIPHADISMRDVYSYPTVTELAEHLESQPVPIQQAKKKQQAFFIPSNLQYFGCAVLQLASYLLFILLAIEIVFVASPWIYAASTPVEFYVRLSTFIAGSFFTWSVLAIAAKWMFVGRWKAEEIPIWSLKYYRFWLIKQIIQYNPMTLLKGYPIYNVYLRLMGAKIGRNVVIECQFPPICADLLTIGDNTILRNHSLLISYKAKNNIIRTGSIFIGRDVVVGEGSVIEINTVMEDATQLGHASCLCEGQTIPKGKHYHGNPAEETDIDFGIDDHIPVSTLRQIVYSFGQLGNIFFVAPVFILLLLSLASYVAPQTRVMSQDWFLQILSIAGIAYTVILILNLLVNTLVSRAFNHLLEVDCSYVRYGFHFFVFKTLQSIGHSAPFTLLFGDSSFIVHYMKLVGYKLHQVIQTGSNFGLEHTHDNPHLCSFGTGTMISDGFTMLNQHESNTTFRLAQAAVGADNFVGNNVIYPPHGKTGNNCLIATKAMVPIDGEIRENVGLLGSPSFEIPRIKEQDPALQRHNRSAGLANKNKHNLTTILLSLLSGFIYFFSILLITYGVAQSASELGVFSRLGITLAFLLFSIGYFIMLERAAFFFGSMKPVTVSIYDKQYWQVERVWKFSESMLRRLFFGTPFRSIINRLLGIKQGKKVFDDGLYVSEKTLVEVGDYCNFNTNCVLQSHSLEDAIYKSDKITVGHRCTIESKAFIHYGVTVGDDVVIKADSFVMKGEYLRDHSVWGGNPAKEIASRESFYLNSPYHPVPQPLRR